MPTKVEPHDAIDFTSEEKVGNNQRWKVVSAQIDNVAQFFIPLAFAIKQ